MRSVCWSYVGSLGALGFQLLVACGDTTKTTPAPDNAGGSAANAGSPACQDGVCGGRPCSD